MAVYSQTVRMRNGRFPRGGEVDNCVWWYSLEARTNDVWNKRSFSGDIAGDDLLDW